MYNNLFRLTGDSEKPFLNFETLENNIFSIFKYVFIETKVLLLLQIFGNLSK